MRFWLVATIVALLLIVAGRAGAEEPLDVAVKNTPPFVIVGEDGKVEGFSVDLAEEIGRRLDPPRKIRFQVQPDLDAQLDAVGEGKVDMGIAATTITAQRQQRLDFSQPFFRSGLGILVKPGPVGLGVITRVLSGEIAWVAVGTLLYILLCAHLIWWAERGSDAFNDRWFPGVATGVWWVIVSMSTVGYGDVVPKKAISKVLAVMIIFTGIMLFGVAVASFSSALTVQNLRSDISGPDDLNGRRVAVISNTTGAVAVKSRGARVVGVATVEEAARLVREGEVDAAVHDLPLLQYHVKNHPGEGLSVVDVVFEPANYGMTFPIGTELRKDVNVVLLRLMSEPSGAYAVLRQKWFGTP
ncbi:MAG: transporter substrate-binding domain-containing protein [Myxococcota bacterium]